MNLSIRHTGFVVNNINRSIEFYEALGLEVWKREIENGSFISSLVGIDGAILETAKLECPNGSLLELIEYKSHPPITNNSKYPSNKHGCSHLAFTVENIEECIKKIIKNGGSLVNKPVTSPDGKVKVIYCHDIDGILLELVEELTD